MATVHLAYYLGRKSDNKSTTWLDRLICAVTRSKFSHVELAVEVNPFTGAAVCWSSSPRDGGVRKANINLRSGHWEVYSVETEVSVKQIERWFAAARGTKYSWLGAVGAHWGWVRGSSKRMFCSEAVGRPLLVFGAERMTPEEFFGHWSDVHKRLF